MELFAAMIARPALLFVFHLAVRGHGRLGVVSLVVQHVRVLNFLHVLRIAVFDAVLGNLGRLSRQVGIRTTHPIAFLQDLIQGVVFVVFQVDCFDSLYRICLVLFLKNLLYLSRVLLVLEEQLLVLYFQVENARVQLFCQRLVFLNLILLLCKLGLDVLQF